MRKTIELPVEFFNSLTVYLEECARESLIAARGVRAAMEYALAEGEDATDSDEPGDVDSQENEDNVLNFPVDNSTESQ
jgi:hypothetical protein